MIRRTGLSTLIEPCITYDTRFQRRIVRICSGVIDSMSRSTSSAVNRTDPDWIRRGLRMLPEITLISVVLSHEDSPATPYTSFGYRLKVTPSTARTVRLMPYSSVL